MNVFETHAQIVGDYASYIRSFISIADPEINRTVDAALAEGKLWPDPLLQCNPAYEPAGSIAEIVAAGGLHGSIPDIFKGYTLYRHQLEAIQLGTTGRDFVVTSGTGSGKSLTYIGSIFHHLLKEPQSPGVTAIVVYPMNALINSQTNEFRTYRENFEKSTGRDFPIKLLRYVLVGPDDLKPIDDAMARCSNYAHASAELGGTEMPHPDELLEDINALEKWRLDMEHRKKAVDAK